MREVLCLHIGQAGCQIGQACWELLCLEHGISPDGVLAFPPLPMVSGSPIPTMPTSVAHRDAAMPAKESYATRARSASPVSSNASVRGSPISSPTWDTSGMATHVPSSWAEPMFRQVRTEDYKDVSNQGIDVFFHDLGEDRPVGRVVPRACFLDLDHETVESVRKSTYGRLFHPDQFIGAKEDSSGNFARGYMTPRGTFMPAAMDRIARMVEQCHSFQGFIIINGLGGGTGSGLTSLLMEELAVAYGSKKSKLCFNVYPSPRLSTAITEPYNAVLGTHSMLEISDVNLVFDNEAAYGICSRQLHVEDPSFTHINQLLSQVLSSLTTSMRFSGALNVDLTEFQTNLVPYPRVHFMLSAETPLMCAERSMMEQVSVNEITMDAFAAHSSLASVDPHHGKYIASCLMYRGDVVPKDVNVAITLSKKRHTVEFVDWCPTGFKCGINFLPRSVPPHSILGPAKRSLCAISNNTAVRQLFDTLANKFDLLYSMRSFVHWYRAEGLEESDFALAREDLAALQKDYEEMESVVEGEIQIPVPGTATSRLPPSPSQLYGKEQEGASSYTHPAAQKEGPEDRGIILRDLEPTTTTAAHTSGAKASPRSFRPSPLVLHHNEGAPSGKESAEFHSLDTLEKESFV